MESDFIHKSNDDMLDPQYMGFLDNLKEDKASYMLEIAVCNGLTVRMKYEYENELPKGSKTRALPNLGQNGGLKANTGTVKRARVPWDSDNVCRGERDANMDTLRTFLQEEPADGKRKSWQNGKNVETEVIMRNGLAKKTVKAPRASNGDAPMGKRQRNSELSNASLHQEPANKKARACQKKGDVGSRSIMWNSVAEKEVEITQTSNDAFTGRKLVLRNSSQTEPANKKRIAHQNKENAERGLLTRNCVIGKAAVENRQNSHSVSWGKRNKKSKPRKNSSEGEPANREKRAFQKKEKLENALILWNSMAEKTVETPQSSDDVSRGRKVVSRRLLRTEPAIRKRKTHPNKEIVESGLIIRNDVTKKQIEVSENSNDISMGKRHRNMKPLGTSLRREPTNRKRKSLLMRKNPEMKSTNPLCGKSKGGLSKMGGQFVLQSNIHDSRLSNIRELDDCDESYVGLASWAHNTKAYITNDNRTERHANNNGDRSSKVEIFGTEDLPHHAEQSPLLANNICYTDDKDLLHNAEKSPLLTNSICYTDDHHKDLLHYAEKSPLLNNNICYTDDEMDMDGQESPRIPGITFFNPRNAKPVDTSSQREPINGKKKNLLTGKNPEMESARPLCSGSKGGPSKMGGPFVPESTMQDSGLSNIRKLDDSNECYAALVSWPYNTRAYITNNNRTEKSASNDGDSSSEVEILEMEDLLRYGEKNPFVANDICCFYDEVDMDGQESPQSPRVTHFNPFREKLIALLKKPFNSDEYSRLLTKATYRKPRQVVRIFPDGKKRVYDTVSKSLLNQYSDLVEKIDVVRSDRQRVLNLLRGFFYYLQNQSVEGSFLPWLDSSCLMVLPEAK